MKWTSILLCLLLVQLGIETWICYASPGDYPTSSPTRIPTPVMEVEESLIPIALHQLVTVDEAGSAVIRLKSFDQTSPNLTYSIRTLPSSGSLYQLSQVFSSYGYEPKKGEAVTAGAVVTGSNNRVFYSRPSPDYSTTDKWGSFEFEVTSSAGVISFPGTVTLTPNSGALIGSSFLLSNEDWRIEGNVKDSSAGFEPYSRGNLLNHYILGSDDKINTDRSGSIDNSLWYFVAPSKYYANHGIAYGGSVSFVISSFSGDFTKLNSEKSNVVVLECYECVGPVGRGITLGYPITALRKSTNRMFSGSPMRITIPLLETAGWVKDPQNKLLDWGKASKCDMIQVLSRLSSFKILGDWTSWYETIAIDNVQLSNTKGQLPVCALTKPDASICTC